MDEKTKKETNYKRLREEAKKDQEANYKRLLEEAEAEIKAKTESFHVTLFKYMLDDRLDMVEALISTLPDANFVDEDKDQTLLDLAISTGPSHSLAFVNMLLDRGADVNLVAGDRFPLETACVMSQIETIKLLLKRGADINLKLEWLGETALMGAVKDAKLDVVKLLLDEGADVNVRDNGGESALDKNEDAGYREEYGKGDPDLDFDFEELAEMRAAIREMLLAKGATERTESETW